MSRRIRFYIINLDRSSERLANISAHLKSLGIEFTRIAAVDGRELSDISIYPLRYFRPLTKGELGCSLSHYKCWQQIIQDRIDYGVVLEDDVIIDKKLLNFISILEQEETTNWDILKLTQYFKTSPQSFDGANEQFRVKELRRKSAIIMEKIANFHLIRFHPPAIGTYGQIVTKRAAARLIKDFVPTRPLDIDMKHLWDMHNLRILSLYPPVLSTVPYPSTIYDKTFQPRQPFKKLWYHISFSYRLFSYNFTELGLKNTLKLAIGKNVDLTSQGS